MISKYIGLCIELVLSGNIRVFGILIDVVWEFSSERRYL